MRCLCCVLSCLARCEFVCFDRGMGLVIVYAGLLSTSFVHILTITLHCPAGRDGQNKIMNTYYFSYYTLLYYTAYRHMQRSQALIGAAIEIMRADRREFR
ncbi:hypothetical protein BZA70DRAFT_138006 [Myxozyma melibiosi]|uniref:Secreted protein n=1 Tax=Myxozyma melibiosi TaxID=54550 RepID=A0ABR1F770_9ASCO